MVKACLNAGRCRSFPELREWYFAQETARFGEELGAPNPWGRTGSERTWELFGVRRLETLS